MNSQERIPVLVYTDGGRDVDDMEAITYLAGSPNIDIVGLVTTHMIPDRRAFIARGVLSNLGIEAPIGVGSIFPMGKEDDRLTTYLREHTVQGRTYEGEGLIECFPEGTEVILDTIARYGSRLRIAVFAPLTDLAKAAEQDPAGFSQIGGLFVQGQALEADGRLLPDARPDEGSYNIREDVAAAHQIFAFQDQVPMTFVGKHAAYKVPFTRADFDRFAGMQNPVGRYLKIHAEKGIASFAERTPEAFERVYGVPTDELESLSEISIPYDLLAAEALVNPESLLANHIGHHTLIGMTADTHGVKDADALKAKLMDTMLTALTYR